MRSLLFTIAALTSACSTNPSVDSPVGGPSAASSGAPLAHQPIARADRFDHVSMVQLIANPRQFNGKRVLVAGFLTMQFENTALWLNKEDANVGISKNAVFVGSPSSVVCPAGTYVQVRGVFDAKFTGHLGAFAGYLKIEKCDQLMLATLPLN
ncbi:hypothetical protein ABL840_25725 [Variovorax sp. NFACC27]|uniref:hypothetical protein n=1 Tax=unclassified Variovorax TaxID=663243 RepID=UPI00115FB1E7